MIDRCITGLKRVTLINNHALGLFIIWEIKN